jgi:hypothetical protein
MTAAEISVWVPKVPEELLAALQRKQFSYSTPPTNVFYFVPLPSPSSSCGVVGDGDNACYEWFHWHNGILETSDCGYGMPEIALRDVINRALEGW